MIFVIVILGLAVLVLIHEFGHFLVAKLLGMKVEEFGIGFPPRILKKKIGETLYSINLLPFGGFVRIYGEDEAASDLADGKMGKERKKGFNDELAWKKSLVVLAGVFMNVALGWLLLSLVFMVGVPRHLMIAEVAPNSPAFTAGLEPGDIITGVEAGDLKLSDPVSSDDFTKLVRSYPMPVNFEIGRGEQKLNLDILPRANPPQGQGPIGINITEVGFEAQPVLQSLASGFSSGWETVKMVFSGLGIFVAQIFTSPQTIQNVAGPVGIVVLAAQATSLGFIYFIQLLALISINLAVLNLLPFPALDGGRFLFLIIDKLRGKPVPHKVQAWVNAAGFVILILLMVFVTVKDIGRLL
jgi:regulator of sigma E protease